MSQIHQGFADDIHILNEKTSALSTVMDNAAGIKQSYATPIHLAVVAENLNLHKQHMASIAASPTLKGGVYAGAAGIVNLSYIANSKASSAILFDINVYQTIFWNLTIEKIAECKTAYAFRKRFETIAQDIEAAQRQYPRALRKRFNDECQNFETETFKGLSNEKLSRWIQTSSKNAPEGQWMHDENLYAHIHSLVKNNAIGAITLDITNNAACEHVEKYLLDKDTSVRLLYVSNIFGFMQAPFRRTDFVGRELSNSMEETARNNLRLWMEDDGRIIECDNLITNRPLITRVPIHKHSYSALVPA